MICDLLLLLATYFFSILNLLSHVQKMVLILFDCIYRKVQKEDRLPMQAEYSDYKVSSEEMSHLVPAPTQSEL